MEWSLNSVYEIQFDRKYNIETKFSIKQDKLGFKNEDVQKLAVRYEPSPTYTLLKGLKMFKKVTSLYLEEATFIDYGCGAGRVLIVAAECGFKRIIGIELSPYLVEVCQRNITVYSRAHKGCDITVLEQNAAEYMPIDANVFYFCTPFESEIYKGVISNIKRSLDINPRKIYILDLHGSQHSIDFSQECFVLIKKLRNFQILTYPN
jgi:SAM-dependent methyltransferase